MADPITITKTDARRFILSHHGLYPPRIRQGKGGVLDYVRHVGCIQFDPINIVGRNPDLVLQSRVKDYGPEMLDELLYTDRKLLDGWDKMASLYALEDWPNFNRRRARMSQPGADQRTPPEKVLDEVLAEVRERGPISSLDFKESEIVDWHWGPTKIVRAALESLFSRGKVGVHHRVNNRRSFDIVERLIPAELLNQPDPFQTEEDYQDWHVQRRVGSLGLASSKSGDYWLGILGTKSRERRTILRRLTERGELIALEIEEISGQTYFIRKADQPTLDSIQGSNPPKSRAAFIAALDNLTWNRNLIRDIFDFEYVWEVYKPKAKRKYGYYVLPVLYGDRFIARMDPSFDKKTRILTVNNWWWEAGIKPDDEMYAALTGCVQDFRAYLDIEKIVLGEAVQDEGTLWWIDQN